MLRLRTLLGFVHPYRGAAVAALAVLAALVAMDLAIPRLVQRVLDEGVAANDAGVVLGTAVAMLAIAALSTVAALANNALSVRVGEGVARDLRAALFRRILSFSFADLDRHRTSQLLVRLTSDVAAVKVLVQVTLRIGTRAPLLMAGSFALMVATDAHLAWVILPILVATAGLVAFFVVGTEPLYRRVQGRLDALNEILLENVSGARLVKALVRGAREGERFEAANGELTSASVVVLERVATLTPALALCVNLGVVAVVWAGGLAAVSGEASAGRVVAFASYLLTTMTPLVMITMLSTTWASGLASLSRVSAILAVVPAVRDVPGAHRSPRGAAPSLALEDVSFRYGPSGEPALSHVSVRVAPGETLAVLGATGAGKSTLVQLVPRLYDATEGRVSVDGEDVRDLARATLLARVGLAPQEPILFRGTIRENLRYGRPDASDAEVEQAARAAQAHEFVSAMQDGYDSAVAQRGANLSGGQKQRLALARALVVDPDLLVLDDATSAVDFATEARIQEALGAGRGRRTTLVVAQRISTVRDADRILVLDAGRAIDCGSHAELLERCPEYREIHGSQLGVVHPPDASGSS